MDAYISFHIESVHHKATAERQQIIFMKPEEAPGSSSLESGMRSCQKGYSTQFALALKAPSEGEDSKIKGPIWAVLSSHTQYLSFCVCQWVEKQQPGTLNF